MQHCMATTPLHHPKQPGAYSAPTTGQPGYINGEHALAGFGQADLYVALIPRAEANATILANHYSRRIVANSYIHLGVWVGGVRRGVLQFGYALNPVAGAARSSPAPR